MAVGIRARNSRHPHSRSRAAVTRRLLAHWLGRKKSCELVHAESTMLSHYQGREEAVLCFSAVRLFFLAIGAQPYRNGTGQAKGGRVQTGEASHIATKNDVLTVRLSNW